MELILSNKNIVTLKLMSQYNSTNYSRDNNLIQNRCSVYCFLFVRYGGGKQSTQVTILYTYNSQLYQLMLIFEEYNPRYSLYNRICYWQLFNQSK